MAASSSSSTPTTFSPQRRPSFNLDKKLPAIPSPTTKSPQKRLSDPATVSKQLQMIDESFEDVTLSLEMEKYQNKVCKRSQKQQQLMFHYHHKGSHTHSKVYSNVGNKSSSQFYTSNDKLLGSTASFQNQAPQSSPPRSVHQQPQMPLDRTTLTPSQRLRVRRKQLNENLESSIRHEKEILNSKGKDMDSLSDDELPDNFIVYNVPLSKSLKALSHKEQYIMNQPFSNHQQQQMQQQQPQLEQQQDRMRSLEDLHLQTPTLRPKTSSSLSESTRSSVFSYNSTISNLTDDNLSLDLKLITIELNKNVEMIQSEESQQRIFHLKKLMQQQNQSRESVFSNVSQSSVVSGTTSKFLSNTRPSNLPPKDKYESLKHSRDFEMILTSAMKLELEKCNSQTQFIKANETQRDKDLQMWKEISTNLKENLSKTSTRELWWRGIPIQFRPKIWCEQIGNKLQISEELTLKLFQDGLKFYSKQDREFVGKRINSYCFPNLSFALENELSLMKIILAYSIYSKQQTNIRELDIGVYSLTAALLYNIRNPVKTFIAFCNILHRKLPYSLLHSEDLENEEYLKSQINSFDKIFTKKLNRVATHFKIYNVKSIEFLQPLCSYGMTQYLDLSKSSKLIDIYLFEGDSFLLRCVLGFLKKIDYKLFGSKSEVMDILGPECLMKLNSNLFGKKDNNELIYGFKYLDLGLDEDFFQCVRDVLRD